jgi:hypothetical protein
MCFLAIAVDGIGGGVLGVRQRQKFEDGFSGEFVIA